jgi:hypothetical protein
LADKAAVEHPNPVSQRPPRSIENDFEFAEMMAPMLRRQYMSFRNGNLYTDMRRVLPYAIEYLRPMRSGRMMLGRKAVTPPTV